jgi:transcriptional regulator with XRE-family HTH domain
MAAKRNQGAVTLARTGETQEEIAAALGVSRAAVGYWIAGTKKPLKAKREALAARYRIPVEAWDETAKAKPGAKPAVTAESLKAAAGEARAAVAAGCDSRELFARLSTMAGELLTTLENDPESYPLEKARVMASVAGTAKMIGQSNGEFDLGARLFQLPIWREVRKALAAGLRGHPAAALAVARELRKLDAGA